MRIYALPMICLLIIVTLLSACGTKTYIEVFKDNHPNAKILHEIKTDKGFVVIFSEEQNIGAAELSPEGNSWSITSSNEVFTDDGITYGIANKESDDEILYGRMNDSNIVNVQLKKDNGDVIEATILGPNQPFWYLQWKYDDADLIGLSKDGSILFKSSFQK